MTWFIRCWLAALLLLSSVSAGRAQPVYEQLRIVAPAAPGGGWDQTARVMQQVLQETGLAATVSVENVPGAAGTIGLARFIGAEQGRGDALLVSGLIMLGAIVMHGSPVTLADVTPIARLTGEYEVIVVPAASPIRSLAELLDVLRQRPEAISWGGGSAGGSDQILAGLVASAAGVPPGRVNYIAFSGGGESLAAIVGGQVTAGVNGLAELAAHLESGAVRALGISSAERLPGLDVPTLREQGIDVVFENWRSLAAPPGISVADRQRLENMVARMVGSPAWRGALERYRWLDRYMAGDAFARYVDAEETRVRDVLATLRADDEGAGPGFYPLFVLAGLASCAVAMAATGRKTRPPRARVAVRWRPLAMLAVAGGAYLALAEPAGFIIAAAVLCWVTARAFESPHPVRDALFAIVLSATAYLLFARLLDVSLPAGPVERWL